MQMANVESLFKKVGVDYVVVKAGRYKDLGNFSRPMTPEERRVLQTLLDDVHAQFIDAVAPGRKLDRDEVVKFADGRVFSGTQAQDLKMIDTLGSFEDAVNEAAKLAGLARAARGDPSVDAASRSSISSAASSGSASPAWAPALPSPLADASDPAYLMD